MDLFSVFEPTGGESPVLVEVPHAGTWIPPAYLAAMVAPVRSLGQDADLHVDALYADAPAEGATLIVANTSRYVLDLNRAEDDWDDAAVEPRPGSLPPRSPGSMPRGLVWRLTTDGEPALARPLPRAELDARIQALHRPYHAAVQAILTRKQAKFGFALLLAAHSMPSNSTAAARRGLRSPATVPRADVVPGTQGRTTASAAFIDAVDAHAAAHGLSVRHDDPYKGGYSTRHYGRPHAGQHAVQVELARRLYMDEQTLVRSARFAQTKDFCTGLVGRLGRLEPK